MNHGLFPYSSWVYELFWAVLLSMALLARCAPTSHWVRSVVGGGGMVGAGLSPAPTIPPPPTTLLTQCEAPQALSRLQSAQPAMNKPRTTHKTLPRYYMNIVALSSIIRNIDTLVYR